MELPKINFKMPGKKGLIIGGAALALLLILGIGSIFLFSSKKSAEQIEAEKEAAAALAEEEAPKEEHMEDAGHAKPEETEKVEPKATEAIKEEEKQKEKAIERAKKSIKTKEAAKAEEAMDPSKPMGKVKFEDPKERDAARRGVIVNMQRKKKQEMEQIKDADKELQSKKERAQAIETWLEKE